MQSCQLDTWRGRFILPTSVFRSSQYQFSFFFAWDDRLDPHRLPTESPNSHHGHGRESLTADGSRWTSVQQRAVRKKGILVIAGGANILLKTSEVFLIVAPVGRLRASREVVKVVIHDHTRHTIHATGLAGHGFSMFANIDDVVLENIVA